MKMLAGLLVAMVASSLIHYGQANSVRHYAGAIPTNRDVQHFLMVCSVCGTWYGGSMERNCIMDKTFETFNNCEAAIMEPLRRK